MIKTSNLGESQQQRDDEEYGMLLYSSLVKSLNHTLGPMNAERAIALLESRRVIEGSRVTDITKLDEALGTIFGKASFSVLHRSKDVLR